MKYLISIVLLFTSITDPINKIAKSNALKKDAKAYYNNKEYGKAVNAYTQLLDSLGTADEDAQMNLANAAYFLAFGDEALGLLKEAKTNPQALDSGSVNSASESLKYASIAENNYDALANSSINESIASNAFNQKGVMSYKQSEIAEAKDKKAFTEQALNNFKNAIKKNPSNESARYNYELLKKLIKQQEEQQQKEDQNQDQNQDQKDQEKKDQEKKDQEKQDQEKKDQEKQDQEKQENKDEKDPNQEKENPDEQDPNQENKPEEQDPLEKLKEKLKEMNISPEKAQMILEALKNNEIQYVQQNKRKATKKKDSSKPDW